MDLAKVDTSPSLSLSHEDSLVPSKSGSCLKTLCDEAIDEFLAGLSPEKHKKNPFVRDVLGRRGQQIAGNDEDQLEQLQKCIEKLELQRKERQTYRILDKITPFLEGLGGLARTCESALQAAPFGVAIVFSGARIVLECAVKVQGALNEVLDALEEIAPDLKCYELIASSQPDSPDIAQAIKRAYTHILDFWCLSAEILSKSYKTLTVSSLIKSMKPIIQSFRDKIRQDSNQVQQLLLARIAVNEAIKHQKQLRREIAEWIQGDKDGNMLDQEADLRTKRRHRTKGTCMWMVENDKFKCWRDAKHNAVLWYNAPPGTGKSIMASAVIDHLQTMTESKVTYFFYSFSETAKRHGLGGFRALALQLLRTLKYIPDALKREYAQSVQQLKYSLSNTDYDTVKRVFHILLNQCPQVYVVLDGLDECIGEDAEFFSALRDLLGLRTNGTSKWFFSSCDVTSLRQTMALLGAQEIKPDFAAVSRDIHTYLKAEEIGLIGDNNWIDENEQNFLYARLRCEIVKGRGYTTQEEVAQALRSFPKGLNSCYIKALERIAGLSHHEQDLARRVFRILIASYKPMTVDELLNALAIRSTAKDHSSTRGPMGGYLMVANVCNPLLTKESIKNCQVVTLYHKSVRDFFLNVTDEDGIDERLRSFLVDYGKAGVDLGMECLTYLSYKRYTKPHGLKALASETSTPQDHAFLRYAATFWYMHLWELEPSPKAIKAVEDFLQSPAFWTCIYVQSHAARHLFARYSRKQGSLLYVPTAGRVADSSALFALPLPRWMVTCSADTASLDRSFCAFVQDWGELLTKSPDNLYKAVPLTLFQPGCHLTNPSKHPRVRVNYSSKVLGSIPGLFLIDSCFPAKRSKHGKALQLRIIRQESEMPSRRIRVYKIAIFPKPKILAESEHLLSSATLEKGWLTTLVRGNEPEGDLVQAWRVDAQNLSIRHEFQGRSWEYEVPDALHAELGLDSHKNGAWRMVQFVPVLEPGRGDASPVTRLFHLRWIPRMECDGNFQTNQSNANEDSSPREKTLVSGFQSSRESGSESDSDSDSESYSDSGSGSDSDKTSKGSTDEMEPGDIHDERGHLSNEPHQDCLIIDSNFGTPVWLSIKTKHSLWSNLIGTRHPTLPMVALSYKPGQVDIIDDKTGYTTFAEITEKESKGATEVVASSRELQFSPCGNYLHLLSVTFGATNVHAICHVALSTYKFTYESPSTYVFELDSSGPSADISYRFAEGLQSVPVPFNMSSWTPESVVLALPPLTYNPKIIKISLTMLGSQEFAKESSSAISTLSSPIFFPASAIWRDPKLMYCDSNSVKGDSYLYLVLGTSKAASKTPQTTASNGSRNILNSEDGSSPSEEKDTINSPPVVLRWKVVGNCKSDEKEADESEEETLEERQTWRQWNSEDDGVSEDIKAGRSAADEVRMLRGDFVVGRKFHVPFRCGLDWTRQGVLSCY